MDKFTSEVSIHLHFVFQFDIQRGKFFFYRRQLFWLMAKISTYLLWYFSSSNFKNHSTLAS